MRGCRGVIRPGSMGARTPGSPTVGADDPIGAVPVAAPPGAALDQAWFGLLRRGAQVERRVADLGVPVAVWRRLVNVAAAQAGLQVLTYLVPADADGATVDGQLVITVLIGSDPACGAGNPAHVMQSADTHQRVHRVNRVVGASAPPADHAGP